MSAPGAPGILGGLVRRFFGSAISTAAGYGIGGAIQPTLEPLTQDLANTTWSLHRVRPIAASIAAALWLRELLPQGEAETEAGLTGFSPERVALLRRAQGQAPPLETLLALRRRDLIGEGELDDGIAQLGLLPEWRARVKGVRNVLPSVTDMVRFAVREVYDPAARAALDLDAELPGAFIQDAGLVGLSPERAAQEWAAHWQLPSAEQGFQMFYRGEISAGELDGLLKALDYAPVWRPRLRALAEAIPPLSDMIRFAVREAYSPASVQRLGLDADFPPVFATEASRHGMTEENARYYWRAHWRLPSALQGYRMLWRGEIDQGELDELLKALDYPPLWRARLSNIARTVPGRIDLKRLLRHEIIDRAEVKAGYQRLGYTPDDAENMTQIAEAEVGDTADTATYVAKARSSLFTRLHSEYVSRQLTPDEALAGLASVGVPAPQRGPVVTLWTAEQTYVRTELTQAQILKAFKKNLLSEDEALTELQERGLSAADAAIRLQSG